MWEDELKKKSLRVRMTNVITTFEPIENEVPEVIKITDVIPIIESLLERQREIIAKMAEKDTDNEWFANRIRNYAPEPTGEKK